MSSLGVTPSRLGVSEAGVGCFVCNSSWRALGPWAGCASLVMKFDSLWLVSYICFAQHRPYTVVYRDVSIHHLVQKSEREEISNLFSSIEVAPQPLRSGYGGGAGEMTGFLRTTCCSQFDSNT